MRGRCEIDGDDTDGFQPLFLSEALALASGPWFVSQLTATSIKPLTQQCQTLTLPKPLVEFANRPMIHHQVEALAAAGVTDIVLAVNYRPEVMTKFLKKVWFELESTLDIGLHSPV